MTRVFLYLLLAATACAQSLFAPNGLARFAGADLSNYTGDGGPAYYATFSRPRAVARDSAGNLYVAEASRIRKINVASSGLSRRTSTRGSSPSISPATSTSVTGGPSSA